LGIHSVKKLSSDIDKAITRFNKRDS
jgi:hypothetical protein